MTTHVDLPTAQAKLSAIIAEMQQGDEIVITEGDQPVAKLVGVARSMSRRAGSAKGLITIADDFDAPLDDFADYMP